MADSPGVVTGGQNAAGVVGGTPQSTNNTGRDWGEAVGTGAAAVGSILGAILSFGAATPAIAMADAAGIGAMAAEHARQNDEDSKTQQRALQGQLDSAQQQRAQAQKPPTANLPNAAANPVFNAGNIGSGQALKTAAVPMPGGSVAAPQMQANNFSGFSRPPVVEQAPVAQNNPAFQITSDARAKKNIASGNQTVSDFLNAVRRHGAWPKGIKDPQA